MKYKLDDIEKKKGYEVPEGYFEDLPLKIQQHISNDRKSTRIGIPSWSLAMAASVVILISFISIFSTDIFSSNESEAETLLAEISQEELLAYLDEIEIDEYDIASAMGDDAGELDTEDMNMLDGIDLDDQAMDDVLLEYDLEDEIL